MKRIVLKSIAAVLAFTLTVCMMASFAPYNSFETKAAKSAAELQKDIQKMKDKIAANEKKIKENDAKISTLSSSIDNYLDTIEQIQKKIESLESNISDTKAIIANYEELIKQTEQQIYEKENYINDKYDDFLEILRRTYENGTQSYLEILFDSDGLVDFLSRADRLGSIISYEQTVLDQLEKEIVTLKNLNITLEDSKKETQDLSEYQASAEEELNKSLDAAEKQLKKLEKDQAALLKVQKKAAALDKQFDKELEALIKKYQEQQKLEANAKLLWPVASKHKRISSKYGPRTLRGEKDFHYGIDIVGKTSGVINGAEIYASADGKVIIATYGKSYGNYIIIDHGNAISTVYAHCSKLSVKVGQTVKRGQVIGYVGSTGNSTGPHLHYEVRVNGTKTDPLSKNESKTVSWFTFNDNGNYVDPVTSKILTYK